MNTVKFFIFSCSLLSAFCYFGHNFAQGQLESCEEEVRSMNFDQCGEVGSDEQVRQQQEDMKYVNEIMSSLTTEETTYIEQRLGSLKDALEKWQNCEDCSALNNFFRERGIDLSLNVSFCASRVNDADKGLQSSDEEVN